MAKPKTRAPSRATRPIKAAPGVIGSTGLQQSGGFVTEEFLLELAGQRGAKVYREMSDNSAVIGAILFALTMLLRQAEWTVQAADDSDEAQEEADFLKGVLFEDMEVTWESVVAEICSMFPYGYAPMEIVYKRRGGTDTSDVNTKSKFDDGLVGLRALSLRAQPTVVRWDISVEDDTIKGLWQQPWTRQQVYIPMDKMLLFRTTEVRNNPEGRSILRNAYRSYYFAKKLEEIEAVGAERDLAGLPVARLPGQYFDPNAPQELKTILASWQRLLTNVRRDKQDGIILPSDQRDGKYLFDFELMSSGSGTRAMDTSKIIERYDRRMAMSVLADFIFLGQQTVGSFALSSDKTALFATAVGGFLKSIVATINRGLVPKLWELNGKDPELQPSLGVGDIETPNLQELAAYISSLAGAGMPLFPDRELENSLRKIGGMPEAPEEGTQTPMPMMPHAGFGTDPRLFPDESGDE